MLPLIAIIIFVAVALAAFAVGSLLDQRSARARLIRERLSNVDKALEPSTGEELALLRDEMLSRIPAFDSLLRRSVRVSNLQTMLEQGGLGIRAGNILILCMISAIIVGGLALLLTSSMAGQAIRAFCLHGNRFWRNYPVFLRFLYARQDGFANLRSFFRKQLTL